MIKPRIAQGLPSSHTEAIIQVFLRFLSSLLCISLVLSGCNRSENRANDYFSQASAAVSKARLFEETHPEDALKLYEDAREKVELIYSDYFSTTIAKQLQNGSATLDGITVKELRSIIIPELQLMIKASVDPMKFIQALILKVTAALPQAQLAQLLADRLVHAHRADEALKQIKVALRAIDDIDSLPDRISLLLKLAINYSDLGIKDKSLEVTFRALTFAKQIPAPDIRKSVLSEIAFTYYRTGAEQKGLEAIRSIQDARNEQDALRSIVERLASENLFAQALAVTRSLRDNPGKPPILLDTASKAIDNELCEQAKPFIETATQLSETYSDRNDEARLWLRMANLSHRCGKDSESLNMLDKAVHASGEGAHNVNYAETASLVSALASSYTDLNQTETALSLITSALPIAQKIRTQHDHDKVFADIAITLVHLGEYEKAERLLSSVRLFGELARATAALARGLHAAGHTERAVDLLANVRLKLKESSDPEERTTALLLLRDTYFELKLLNDALEVGLLLREYGEGWKKHVRSLNEQLVGHGEIALALKLAREINDPYLSGVLLADVARFQAKHGSLTEAVALMEQAFRTTKSGNDEKRKLAMSQYFAEAFLLMKWPKEAYDLITTNNLPNQALWLSRIAVTYSELGKLEEAAQALNKAIEEVVNLSPLESQLQTMIEVASAFTLVGIEPNEKSQGILRDLFRKAFSIDRTQE